MSAVSTVTPESASALLQPFTLAGRRVPNRIVFGAHPTNFGVGQVFTERHRAYYRARAAGGAGMLVTEALTVHPLDWPYEHVPFGHSDAIVPSLQTLLAELRETNPDMLVLAQLNHWGGQTSGKQLRQSPWAPSNTADVASKKVARAMLPHELHEVVAAFGEAAGRVRAAELDGVELNAGQHALLRQFLSPLTNHRPDEYGGELANRLRFVQDVIAAVRAALGPEAVLGLKLVGDELAPWGGLQPEDCQAIATQLVADGGLSYLSAQIGGPYSAAMTEAAMPVAQAHAAPLAAGMRTAVAQALPVLAEGRIEQPAAAAEVLQQGQADAVVMTRALVSDPDLPRKLMGVDAEPVRPHIGMLRYFSVVGDWNRPLGDLINPRAGREACLPPVTPASAPRRAVVVGAGPAGMEAAATLARQGHAVTLLERQGHLGGTAALLAARVPTRGEYGLLVDYYEALLAQLGVTVELDTAVTPAHPALVRADVVYLATGAVAPEPALPTDGTPVLSVRALLGTADRDGAAPLPDPDTGRVAVVDTEYGFHMGNAVEHLLGRGYGVDVVTDDLFVGRGLVESAELLWFGRVGSQGVAFHPRLLASHVAEGTLVCTDRFGGGEHTLGPLAAVIVTAPEVPEDALYQALQAQDVPVVRIGDAIAPRLMGEAIQTAHRAALSH